MKILGWGLSFFVLFAVTVVFYFLLSARAMTILQTIEDYHADPTNGTYKSRYYGAVTFVFATMFAIVLFNKILMVLLFHLFTDLERNNTTAKFQFSFGLKYCCGLFFTTALMTLAVEAIRFENYYEHSWGVIEEETIMFFMNALFVPLFWLVNPFQLVRIIKRGRKHGKSSLTQSEAN